MMKKISILTLTLLLCAFAQKSLATVDISNAIIFNPWRFLPYDNGKDYYELYPLTIEVYAYDNVWLKLKAPTKYLNEEKRIFDTDGADFDLYIMDSEGNIVNEVREKGTYTLVISGENGYEGEVSQTLYITDGGSWVDYKAESFSNIDNDNHVITIMNEAEMARLAWNFNRMRDKVEYKGWTFRLARDLDLSAHYWDPIGSWQIGDETEFVGHFDGQGHTISGVHILRESSQENIQLFYPQGLFAILSYSGVQSSIKNLTLTESEIVSGYNKGVGAIAGYLNNGSVIENCHVTSSVNVVCLHGDREGFGGDAYGGILGYNFGHLRGCTSSAHVFKKWDAGTCRAFGGVVGDCNLEGSGTIVDCLYYGDQVLSSLESGAVIGRLRNSNSSTNPVNCSYSSTILKGCDGKDISGITPSLMLANEADNTAIIAANMDISSVNVTLAKRTLYKDGSWNTLCLPFNLSSDQIAARLNPSSLMELDADQSGVDSSDGTLYLNFKEASSIDAGKPYIVKWESGGSSLANPVFTNVTITSAAPLTIETSKTDFDIVQFIGTYSSTPIEQNDKNSLYLGADNTLYYPSVADFSIGAFRAYFHVNFSSQQQIKAFCLNFGDEETGIREITTPSNFSNPSNLSNFYYSLDGRRILGAPTAKGLYIHNGKKMIIE